MDSEENYFSDWVISQASNHTILADTMRSAATRSDGSVVLLFIPDTEEQVDVLKQLIVDRFIAMAAESVDPDSTGFRVEVDAQQISVHRKTYLLLKVRNADEQ